jgi:hypothetical protein
MHNSFDWALGTCERSLRRSQINSTVSTKRGTQSEARRPCTHIKHMWEIRHEDRELSAMARACILISGDRRVTGILQSAQSIAARALQASVRLEVGEHPIELPWSSRVQ